MTLQEQAKQQKKEKILRELEDLLVEKGVLRSFKKAYLPKAKKGKYISPYIK